jgi:hypothetical protein
VIPGNDDAIRSCALVVKAIAAGIEAGKQKVSAAELKAPRNGGAEAAPEGGEAPPAEADAPAEAAAETVTPTAPEEAPPVEAVEEVAPAEPEAAPETPAATEDEAPA